MPSSADVVFLQSARSESGLIDSLPLPDRVRSRFGYSTFRRAQILVLRGAVGQVTVGHDFIQGDVKGEVTRRPVWQKGKRGVLLECSCPLSPRCEHLAALYLAVRQIIGGDQEVASAASDAGKQTRPPAAVQTRKDSPSGGERIHLSLAEEGIEAKLGSAVDRLIQALREAGFESRGRETYHLGRSVEIHRLLDGGLEAWRRAGIEFDLEDRLQRVLRGDFEVCPQLTASWDGRQNSFEMRWNWVAGGRELSGAETRGLRSFPGRYYRLSDGQLVSVQRRTLQRLTAGLVRMGYSPDSPLWQRRPLHYLSRLCGLVERNGARAPRRVDLPPSLARFRESLKTGGRVDLDLAELEPVLRSYQREGVRFLGFLSQHGLGGILADEMGLGKTLQTLTLIELGRRRDGEAPSLVVCPTSVGPNWVEESRRFTPGLLAHWVQSSSELKRLDLADYDLTIIPYSLLTRFVPDERFRYLVLDEAQFIKNPRAKRTRAVKKIQADCRLALTGTPIENSLLELWSIFDFLMPGLLGTLPDFQRTYQKPIVQGHEPELESELANHIRPYFMRRLKSEVASELPPKIEQNIYCTLAHRQRKLYKLMAAAARRKVRQEVGLRGWEKSRMNVLTVLLRLRQLCCHPGLLEDPLRKQRSGKLEAFLELVEPILAWGRKIVVFSQFVRMLRILESELAELGVETIFLHGGSRDRQSLVRDFQRRTAPAVFLISLRAGGTGLNLTAAEYSILYDPWWNPAVEDQAIDRIHRIGQKNPVTAYRLIAQDTIEERMLELKEKKKDLAERVLGGGGMKDLTPEDVDWLLA